MVAEPDGEPTLDDDPDGLFDRPSGRLVDDVKNLLDILSGGVGEGPSCEFSATGLR